MTTAKKPAPKSKPKAKPAPKSVPQFCADLKPGQQITINARRMNVIAIEGDAVILNNQGTPVEWKRAWIEACPDKRK